MLSNMRNRYLFVGVVIVVTTVILFSGYLAYWKRKQTFSSSLRNFPWMHFQNAVYNDNLLAVRSFSDLLVSTLLPFIHAEPTVPPNPNCIAPPFIFPTCRRLSQPRKVGILLTLDFDVDALEIHLNELNQTVDKFFLIEKVFASGDVLTSKPLLWEFVQRQKRFRQFLPKIVYLTIPNLNHSFEGITKTKWIRKVIWESFLHWNKNHGEFSQSDFIGFADASEIPDRNNVYRLKHCTMESRWYPLDIGFWYPFPYLDTIYESNQHIRHHPYATGASTYWPIYVANEYRQNQRMHPWKQYGKSSGFLLGGINLKLYAYPPLQILNILEAVQHNNLQSLTIITEAAILISEDKEAEAVQALNLFFTKKANSSKIHKVSDVQALDSTGDKFELDRIVKYPWFYKCNPDRYPSLTGRHDYRLNK